MLIFFANNICLKKKEFVKYNYVALSILALSLYTNNAFKLGSGKSISPMRHIVEAQWTLLQNRVLTVLYSINILTVSYEQASTGVYNIYQRSLRAKPPFS